MAIAQPFLIGTVSGTRGQASGTRPPGTPQTITPAQAIPAGSLIIIGFDTDQYPVAPYSITDTAGNTYSPAGPDPWLFTNDPGCGIWCATNVQPLSTSSTITYTPIANAQNNAHFQEVNAVAICVPSGVNPSNSTDQTGNGYSQSKTLTITTPHLALGGEIAVAYWVATQASFLPQPGSDWNVIATFQGVNNTHWVAVAWKILTTAGPLYAKASVPSSGASGWGGVVATFQPSIAPSASLGCGGTLTPYPVVAVNGTATLHCGGSILSPAQLAPWGPPGAPVFPAGYGPLPADFTNWAQQALGYCTSGTVFRAEQHTSQALTATTFTPMQWDTVLEDPFKGWSAVATSSQPAYSWLVPWDGNYRIRFRYQHGLSNMRWNNPAVGVSGVNPTWEGGAVFGTGGDIMTELPLAQGDYVQLLAWCGNNANTNVTGPGFYPSVEIDATQTELAG